MYESNETNHNENLKIIIFSLKEIIKIAKEIFIEHGKILTLSQSQEKEIDLLDQTELQIFEQIKSFVPINLITCDTELLYGINEDKALELLDKIVSYNAIIDECNLFDNNTVININKDKKILLEILNKEQNASNSKELLLEEIICYYIKTCLSNIKEINKSLNNNDNINNELFKIKYNLTKKQ